MNALQALLQITFYVRLEIGFNRTSLPSSYTTGSSALWRPRLIGTKDMSPARSQTTTIPATATLLVTQRPYLLPGTRGGYQSVIDQEQFALSRRVDLPEGILDVNVTIEGNGA